MKHPLSDKLHQVHSFLKNLNANALASYVREACDVLESEKKESVQTDLALPFRLTKEGDSWCCVRHEFVNFQESLAGFGDTIEEAIKDLFYVEGLRDKRLSGQEERDSSQETVQVSTEPSQAPEGSSEDLPDQTPPLFSSPDEDERIYNLHLEDE